MAKFIQLNGNLWVNIEMIVTMYYEKEDNKTYIFSADSPDDHVTCEGDVTREILNMNNDLSMRDKLFTNRSYDRFKSVLASMLARLDHISRVIEKNWK